MFISPLRSELNAIDRPSGDHDPRLSSRLVAMVSRGTPAGRPVAGSTGSVQRLAFWRRMENASLAPSGESEGSRSCPAPVVICCGAPRGLPLAVTPILQRLRPPVRYDAK